MAEKSKLRVEDNWGRLTYYLDDVKVDATKSYEAVVEWPDGSRGSIHVHSSEECHRVSDHGHDDVFYDHRLRAVIDHHGFEVLVPLEKLCVLQLIR